MNIFEQATRYATRFPSTRGPLTVEDLWDLPLKSTRLCLDEVAKTVYRELKETEQESFVEPTSSDNDELKLKMDIVKHIIKVKLDERKAAELAELNAQKKQRIMSIIAEKRDNELASKDISELEGMLAEL